MMLPYALGQLWWMLRSAVQLVVAMSTGVKWIVQMVRLFIFVGVIWLDFVPHVWWYLTSPNIIRRVSYRSSEVTKRRNLLRVLEAEGVPLEELLHRSGGRTGGVRRRQSSTNNASATRVSRGNLPRPPSSSRAALPLLRRRAQPRTPMSFPRDRTELEWLLRYPDLNLNPADGSTLRSIPRKRQSFATSTVPNPSMAPRRMRVVRTGEAVSIDGSKAARRPRQLTSANPNVVDDTAAEVQPTNSFTTNGEGLTLGSSSDLHTPSTEAASISSPPATDGRVRKDLAHLSVSAEEDTEDRENVHNRSTMDIILPVPLDSLMKTLDIVQRSSSRLQRKKFPIAIVVTGGVWIIGSYFWGTMLARVLAARGYVVFCPDYRNFPQTTMEGMTLDVSDAIQWVLNNADRYNGDLSNVTLVSHSAGAHLCMMSLLSQAQLHAYENLRGDARYAHLPPPSDVAYNVPRYNPRKSIHRFVSLSGLFNLESLAPRLHRQGLNTPVLRKIAGGQDQLARFSIPAYFDNRRGGETGEVLPDNVFDFFPQRMAFLHGDADKSTPLVESASLVRVMREFQFALTKRRQTAWTTWRRHCELRRAQDGTRGPTPEHSGCAADQGSCDTCTTSSTITSRPAGTSDAEDTAPGVSSGLCSNDSFSSSGSSATGDEEEDLRHVSWPPMPPPRMDSCEHVVPMAPPVELEFIVIPGACHTDAIVEECIAGGRSCCADFICDYESAAELPTMAHVPTPAPRLTRRGAAHQDRRPLGGGTISPDGVLPLSVPPEERSRRLRFSTLCCPF